MGGGADEVVTVPLDGAGLRPRPKFEVGLLAGGAAAPAAEAEVDGGQRGMGGLRGWRPVPNWVRISFPPRAGMREAWGADRRP